MKKLLVIAFLTAMLLAALVGCASHRIPQLALRGNDYQWHKQTLWIKLHWNYLRPDKDTIIAEGFVEPFDPHNGINTVRLELVGLDEAGNVVNSASGMPADDVIVSPIDKSPFRITMKLNGKETDFTVKGYYYYFLEGGRPSFDSKFLDNIPLKSDEPL